MTMLQSEVQATATAEALRVAQQDGNAYISA